MEKKIVPRIFALMRDTDQKLIIQKLIDRTQIVIREHELEISGVSKKMHFKMGEKKKVHLTNDEEVIKLMKTKNYVFSDSVLRVRKKNPFKVVINRRLENTLSWFKSVDWYKAFDGVHGESVLLEWKVFSELFIFSFS